MKLSSLELASLTGICLLSLNNCSELQTNVHKPNIIFYITDDIGWNDLGCYGNSVVKTPNIDQLATSSMVFDNAYLASSSCSPSRASIATSRYPHNHGAPELHTRINLEKQPFFPRQLKEAGYYTIFNGKAHGFEIDSITWDTAPPAKGPGLQEDWVNLLKNRDKSKPFFAWFASVDAHRKWQFTNEAPVYDPSVIEVPPMLYEGPMTRQDLADYYHEVSRTDYYMGELIKELKAQGVYENTIIVHCSDNGRPFPRCKTRCYDSGMKTYLLVYGPGIKPGRSNSPVSVIDIGPTLLDFAGIPTDKRMQGVSFRKVLTNPEAKSRDFTFSEQNWHVFQAHQRMVRFGNWMYIKNNFPERRANCQESNLLYPAGKELWEAWENGLTLPEQEDVFRIPRPEEELYNVKKDPYQFDDLSEDPLYRAVLDSMRQIMAVWVRETGDHVPANPTNDRQDVTGLGEPEIPFERGEVPGEKFGADTISRKGPVLINDIPAL